MLSGVSHKILGFCILSHSFDIFLLKASSYCMFLLEGLERPLHSSFRMSRTDKLLLGRELGALEGFNSPLQGLEGPSMSGFVHGAGGCPSWCRLWHCCGWFCWQLWDL